MSHSDIQAVRLTATGTVHGGPSRMLGLHYHVAGGGAGLLTFRDGGAGGTVVCIIDGDATAGSEDVTIPGHGIRFETDMHLTLANVDGVTVFLEKGG